MTSNLREDRVAITGAEGFIGSKLLGKLPRARILDRTVHDLGDPASLSTFLENVEVIFHLAGVNAGSGYSPSNESMVINNVLTTRNLLEAVRRYSIGRPLTVLVSSVHVYSKEEAVFTEDSKLGPPTYYGLTKLAQELLVQEAAKAGTVDYLILRASNVYGAGCRPYYNSAVATFCEKMRCGEVLELYGNGKSQLDLIHVSDVVSLLLRVDELRDAKEPIYNLSYGHSVDIQEVVEVLAEVSGIVPNTRLVDTPPVRLTVENSKLLSTLDIDRLIDLRTGLRDCFTAKS